MFSVARIVFDDDVESHQQFWNLIGMVGDRDKALGMLVRLFRLAQDRFGHGQTMTEEELRDQGLTEALNAGWVIPCDSGLMVRNPEKWFGWYRQRVDAGRKRAEAPRSEDGTFRSEDSARAPKESSEAPANCQRKPAVDQPTATATATANEECGGHHPTPEWLAGKWNELCGGIKSIRVPLNPKRRKLAAQRLKESPRTKDWIEALERVARSKKCQGLENDPKGAHPNWKAHFEWFLAQGRLDAILEGNWDGKGQGVQKLSYGARIASAGGADA